jgi:hypothetical protein
MFFWVNKNSWMHCVTAALMSEWAQLCSIPSVPGPALGETECCCVPGGAKDRPAYICHSHGVWVPVSARSFIQPVLVGIVFSARHCTGLKSSNAEQEKSWPCGPTFLKGEREYSCLDVRWGKIKQGVKWVLRGGSTRWHEGGEGQATWISREASVAGRDEQEPTGLHAVWGGKPWGFWAEEWQALGVYSVILCTL